jgi:hypothetical protein
MMRRIFLDYSGNNWRRSDTQGAMLVVSGSIQMNMVVVDFVDI